LMGPSQVLVAHTGFEPVLPDDTKPSSFRTFPGLTAPRRRVSRRRGLLRPEAERRYPGQMLEIPVRTQHHELVPETKLREERIDRSDLKAAAAALVAKVCSGSVVFALRHDQRQRSESIEDLRSRFWAAESLEKLLKNQPGGENRSFALKGIGQEVHARIAIMPIPAEGK